MANPSETDRSQIYTELAAATSPKSAEILMHEVLDVRWDDIATKSEIADVRSEMRVGFAQQNASFERQLRIQSNRMIALMIALFSLLGGLVLAVH